MQREVAQGITETTLADGAIRFRSYQVLGCRVHGLSMAQAMEVLDAYVASKGSHVVLAANPDKAVLTRKDRELRERLERADVLIADGSGVVAAVRLKYGQQIDRLCGVDLMYSVVEHSVKQGYPMFFLGAKEAINAKVVDVLQETFPTMRVAGRANGYFGEEDEEALVQQINDSGAKVLFVALGSPKQEIWIDRNRDKLKVSWIQGVGGSFNVHSGMVKRAPELFQRMHMEWLYRTLAEPTWERITRNMQLVRFSRDIAKDLIKNGRTVGS